MIGGDRDVRVWSRAQCSETTFGGQDRRMRIDDLEGKEVAGRFALKKMIGKGGYGAVFEAEQLSVGRRCAVKMLLPGYGDEDAVEQRFRAEARSTSRLAHPNTIVLFDFGVDEATGFLFLATEYLDGDTLHAVMVRERRLSLERTLSILDQVAGSLGDAHRIDLVHRDIKPKNIMLVNRAGQPDFVKVIDFGIAKTLGSGLGSDEGLTKTGMMVGTPQYMAPEQLLGSGLDGRVDQYALAVVGYKMLTGRNPFHGSTPMEMAMRHINERPLPLRTYRPELRVNSEFEDVFLKALAKVPEHRFASTEAFVRALRESWSRDGSSPVVVNAGIFGEVDARVMQKQTLMLSEVILGEVREEFGGESERAGAAQDVNQVAGEPGEESTGGTRKEGPEKARDNGANVSLASTDECSGEQEEAMGANWPRRVQPEIFTGEEPPKMTMEVRRRELEDRTGVPGSAGGLGGPDGRGMPKIATVACSVAFVFSSIAGVWFFGGSMAEEGAEAARDRENLAEAIEKRASGEASGEGAFREEEAFEGQQRQAEEALRAGQALVTSGLRLAGEALKKEEERLIEEIRRAQEVRARRLASRPGDVTVTMIPWGTLVVNGELHGDATRQELRLPPGQHRLALHQHGVPRATTTVDVRAGQSRMVVLEARSE